MKQHPLLYQINTRVTLGEVARSSGYPTTLDDIPDEMLDDLRAGSFDWVWLLGVWRPSPWACGASRSDLKLRRELQNALPDLREEDFVSSPFAIRGYEVSQDWGGSDALARLRRRLAQRGLKLMLDFVPNHVAVDHPWVDEHPEYFVSGTPEDLVREPRNFVRIHSGHQERIFAHGRDPYFPGWGDTLQLDYRRPAVRLAMAERLQHISRLCDGVRCDMAMLVLPDIFERTWGPLTDGSDNPVPAPSFWSAAIAAIKNHRPDFVFMAEAYWDLEWRLQQEGFDYTYDKRLYDRLRAGLARPVREHLLADPTYQTRSVRFLENHDEPRAAAVFSPEVHRAAAVLTYFVPGLRFFHEGQIDGRRTHVSMHVGRRPVEAANAKLRAFYSRLIDVLGRPELHGGDFRLHLCHPAWADNPSCNDLIVFSWSSDQGRLLVAVNYAPHRSQGFVKFDFALKGKGVLLVDQLSDARHERSSQELAERGLYLDMSPWGYHIFDWVESA
jgi:glycosidase